VSAPPEAAPAADLLRHLFGEMPMAGTAAVVRLEIDPGRDDLGTEGYELTTEDSGVRIVAPTRAGIFYGAQTLLQALKPADEGGWELPRLRIVDRPRFGWRGLMLDCSRTFQSPEYIRRTIDRMATYKLNVLHLHLTDDQGWRLEIKRYPALTAQGAAFPGKYGEPPQNQGFYTQEQMRELVAFASARNVTVVPEIEMPGHSLAALSCFPELSCTGGAFEIFPFFKGPNVTPDILCAGNDKTFEFLGNVLAEVAEIFPSKFVHVGGDEAPKARWKGCPKCQERIRAEGLKDEHELQSWFIRRAEAMLEKQGKRLIGWDEILEGGLAPNAAVMSWRGTQGGLAAARQGHDVVMSPTSHCYFDYTYKNIDTRRAYSFEPVPDELESRLHEHVLGLQANFWSHIDRTPERVNAQLFPRLLAVAERGWSPMETRDWDDFAQRVRAHLPRLEAMGIRCKVDDSLSEAQTTP